MSKKVMFSTHGLVEGDFAYKLDELGFPTDEVVSKKVITGQDTGGQVYYVKALASIYDKDYDVDLVTRRVDPRICPQFGGTFKDLGPDINYTVEKQWHEVDAGLHGRIKSNVLRVPAGGNFAFVPKEEIVPLLGELMDNLVDYYKKEGTYEDIAVVEGHYRDGMLAAAMLCDRVEQDTGKRPVMLVTSHSLGHKKYERNLPKYQNGEISEDVWKWHNFEDRINHEKYGFEQADIIIATSPDEERRLAAEPYLVDTNKVTVIPPGYNSMLFKPMDDAAKQALMSDFVYHDLDGNERHINLSGRKVVSSLGRVVPDKGFVELSRTMKEIIAKDRNVIYMVSGEKGNPVTEECKKELAGVMDNVVFLPSLNQGQMAQVYNVSSIFVMSSLNEAFGMVPIEAMGCRTAVVVGRSGFNDYAHCADIRNDNEDFSKAIGFYAPSQEVDRQRQVKAISLLLNNDELREQVAQNGYDFVSKNLTWQQIANKKNMLIRDVIRQRNTERSKVSGENFFRRAVGYSL